MDVLQTLNHHGDDIPTDERVTVEVWFTNGATYFREFAFEDLDGVEAFLRWYREAAPSSVWTWHCPPGRWLVMMSRAHIASIRVEGYIAPMGRMSRWYERLLDRLRVFCYLRKAVRGWKLCLLRGKKE